MTAHNSLVPQATIPVFYDAPSPFGDLMLAFPEQDQHDRAGRWTEAFLRLMQESDDTLGVYRRVVLDLGWVAAHTPVHDGPPPRGFVPLRLPASDDEHPLEVDR